MSRLADDEVPRDFYRMLFLRVSPNKSVSHLGFVY